MPRRALPSLACALPLLWLAGCSSCSSSSHEPAGPAADAARPAESAASRGVRLSVARAELLRFASTVPGTRVAAALRRADGTSAPCPRLVAEGKLDDLPGLVESLRCPNDTGAEDVAVADMLLEDAASDQTIASGDVDKDGLLTVSVRAAARLPPFLVPGEARPGPPLLGDDGVAFGGQIRARQVALTAPARRSVLPDLSALVSARALDGRVAFSLLVPDEDSAALPLVLAFGVKDRALVERGVEVALADMARRYGVPRVSLSAVGDAPARKRACLGPLRLVEGLSPCVVLDDERVIFSWNERAMQRALAATPSAAETERAGFRLHTDAAARASEHIARARGAGDQGAAAELPATLEVLAPTPEQASRGAELILRVGGTP